MLNEAQNISTGAPIQLHDGHVHHDVTVAVPFWFNISMPKMFPMDSFFRFEKKDTFFNMEHIGF